MSALPFAIGGAPWPGLSKLIEEAGEVLQVAGKLVGTGGALDHWDGTDLGERLVDELGDLQAAIAFFVEVNDLPEGAIKARRAAKLQQFHLWHAQQRAADAHAAEAAEVAAT